MTTFISHRAFYKNAKQAFYEIAGKVIIITTLAALLVFTPSIATAQMETDEKNVCLFDTEPRGNQYWWLRHCPEDNREMLWDFADDSDVGRWVHSEQSPIVDPADPILFDILFDVLFDSNEPAEMLFDENGEPIWDFTNVDDTNVEMLFDEGVEHAVVITSDNNNADRWVHTTKCENSLGHDYDFDRAVQDEHGNWWVECKDCGYWGLWIDGEVI